MVKTAEVVALALQRVSSLTQDILYRFWGVHDPGGGGRFSAWVSTRSWTRTPWRMSWPQATAASSCTTGRTPGTSAAICRFVGVFVVAAVAAAVVIVIVIVRLCFMQSLVAAAVVVVVLCFERP